MDRLTALLRHFELRSRLYFSGRKCGVMDFGDDDGLGHVHVLRAGTLTLVGPDGNAVVLDAPTVLFYPYPTTHRLQIDPPRCCAACLRPCWSRSIRCLSGVACWICCSMKRSAATAVIRLRWTG